MKAIIRIGKLGDKPTIVLSDDSGKETLIIPDNLEIEVYDPNTITDKKLLRIDEFQNYYRIAIETERILKVYADLNKFCSKY